MDTRVISRILASSLLCYYAYAFFVVVLFYEVYIRNLLYVSRWKQDSIISLKVVYANGQ